MEKITRFELRTATTELKDKTMIRHGCTADNPDPTILKTFDNKADALAELSKYECKVRFYDWNVPFWLVEEVWVEEDEYTLDEDGEIADCDYLGVCGYADFEQEAD